MVGGEVAEVVGRDMEGMEEAVETEMEEAVETEMEEVGEAVGPEREEAVAMDMRELVRTGRVGEHTSGVMASVDV